MNDFSQKIKELRGDKSIRKAARGIGISHTYLDSLEKGYDARSGKERKPTVDVINKISKYYNFDFFELSRLAGVFVSLKETPDNIKKDELNKLRKKFKQYANDNENEVREKYIELLTDKMTFPQTILLKNVYTFLIEEGENNEIFIEDEGDTNTVLFMASLLQIIVSEKNSNNIEAYKDVKNDFDKFLKAYIKIK
ncbi:helix-turn-helix domain-containing protein [Staphylococcus ureilyticus]|uniref:helix-turn-helix domain-containing protein n=1 Tax=Staphylococcus ureilyticus TaxID=94138 RepID=UPI0021D331BC|nr:helix-turn-helix transcriptional regulator [Staphylococcus ureilyticus]UXS60504.1 helix-turn-helix transcriptional regulator [Staphylococcus ureilyticus]